MTSGTPRPDPSLDKENYMDLEEPATKRRNMMEGSTSRRQHLLQFGKGSVTRVRVFQFMTYSSATFEPGPRLNLVLGPNGTGKSSLVCALCLGLAGGTKLLGRGDNAKEFIQRGKPDGWVEVSLSRGDGTEVVVRRELKLFKDADGKHKASSKWFINGASKLMKDVTELMTQLNVQLDNLCQFLPQDKVVEFARLNPNELLTETEKAIGDATLYALHEDLKKRRTNLKEVSQGTETKRRQLEKLQQDQARQQHEYERLQRRAALLDEVELLKKKVTLLDLAAVKAEVREVRAMYAQADALLKTQRANMDRQRGPLQQLETESKKVERTLKALQDTLRALVQEGTNFDTQANNYDSQIERKTKEIADLQGQSDDRKARLAEARRSLAQAQQEAAQVPESMPPEQAAETRAISHQLHTLTHQTTEVQLEVRKKEQDLHTLIDEQHELGGRLQHITNVTYHRLGALEGRYRGIGQAYQWMQQNRDQFRGRVYGPVAVEVQVADPLHSKFLNMAIPSWIWGTFVTMYREDEELLGKVFKQHGWKMPRTAYLQQDYNTPLAHPDGEPAAFAHLGITATLDQVMEAPLLVKRFIDDQCHFSRSYIGTQFTEDNLRGVEEAGLGTVYTPVHKHSWKRSKYNATLLSGRSDPLRGPVEALAGQVDAQQVAQLEGQIKAAQQAKAAAEQELHQLKGQLAGLVAQQGPLKDRKHELAIADTQRINQLKRLLAVIKRHQTTVDRLQAEPEPLERKEQLEADAADLARLVFEKYAQLAANLRTQLVKARDIAAAEMQGAELKALLEQKKAGTHDLQQALKETEAGHKELALELTTKKEKEKELRQRAEAQGLLDDALRQRVEAIVGDREAVLEQAAAKKAEADAIAVGDQGVLARYQERAARIAELEGEVGDEEGELARRQAEIDEIMGRWLPDLQRMVEKIHTTFSRNFEEMGCAGEVALVPHDDFDKWAIQIRVKFRASEELQVLTAHRQSGGERSVSTILYLIALQDVTVTPFRVVDEINQGMDPINERKVYTQLVDASTRPNTPQCFLLTPKLLPDLPYTGNITILEIFNGREIDRGLDISDMDAMMFGTRHHGIAV